MMYVLAFLGLCWAFTVLAVGASLLGFWIWDRWPVKRAAVKLPVAKVRR